MFEHLFGSKTRVKLIKFFLDNPEGKFYVRELTRLTDTLLNSVRRELENLEAMKLISCEEAKEPEADTKGVNARKYYKLNDKNIFYHDLVKLFSKADILIEKKMVDALKRIEGVDYLAIGGFFSEDDKAKTDIILIGDMDREKVVEMIDKFEKEVRQPLRYTMMDEIEFKLRKDIADDFIESIINNEKWSVIVDKLNHKHVENEVSQI